MLDEFSLRTVGTRNAFSLLGLYEAAFGSLCHARIRHGTESPMLAFSATCLLDSRAY